MKAYLPVLFLLLASSDAVASEGEAWLTNTVSVNLSTDWQFRLRQEIRTSEIDYDDTIDQNFAIGVACRLSIWPTWSIVSKFNHWPPTIGGGRFKTTVDEGQAAHHYEGKEQVYSQSLNPNTQKIKIFSRSYGQTLWGIVLKRNQNSIKGNRSMEAHEYSRFNISPLSGWPIDLYMSIRRLCHIDPRKKFAED